MRPVNDVFDLIVGVGSVLHFAKEPRRVTDSSSPLESLTGLLLRAPSMLNTDNPIDVIPVEAIAWSHVFCTERSLAHRPGGSLIDCVVTQIESLLRNREMTNMESFYPSKSKKGHQRAAAGALRQKVACRDIVESGLQPCQILFPSGTHWVWVHPLDVSFL